MIFAVRPKKHDNKWKIVTGLGRNITNKIKFKPVSQYCLFYLKPDQRQRMGA